MNPHLLHANNFCVVWRVIHPQCTMWITGKWPWSWTMAILRYHDHACVFLLVSTECVSMYSIYSRRCSEVITPSCHYSPISQWYPNKSPWVFPGNPLKLRSPVKFSMVHLCSLISLPAGAYAIKKKSTSSPVKNRQILMVKSPVLRFSHANRHHVYHQNLMDKSAPYYKFWW